MTNFSQKILAVFHSYQGSFEAWQRAGILERELLLYRNLRPHFMKILFVTYSKNLDKEQKLLGDIGRVVARGSRELRRADIIKTNQMSAILAAIWLKIFHPRKKLVVRAGFQWSQFQRHKNWLKKIAVFLIEFFAYLIANHIIVTSLEDKKYVMRRYCIAYGKITVISNLIDTDLFKPLGERKDRRLICSVGRLEAQKNYGLLINALAGTKYQLLLYGEGTKKSELEKQAKRQNIKAEFRGRISNYELARELNKCGIFVSTSLYEGNPKAVLEAMALGLPVIASDILAHQGIIKNGKDGLLIPLKSENFRIAIDNLQSEEKAAALGKSAREAIIKTASPEAVVSKELAVYQNL